MRGAELADMFRCGRIEAAVLPASIPDVALELSLSYHASSKGGVERGGEHAPHVG